MSNTRGLLPGEHEPRELWTAVLVTMKVAVVT